MKSVLLKNDKSLDFTGLEGIFNTAGLFLISKYLKIETFWVKKNVLLEDEKRKKQTIIIFVNSAQKARALTDL